jgi:hypothetical protein
VTYKFLFRCTATSWFHGNPSRVSLLDQVGRLSCPSGGNPNPPISSLNGLHFWLCEKPAFVKLCVCDGWLTRAKSSPVLLYLSPQVLSLTSSPIIPLFYYSFFFSFLINVFYLPVIEEGPCGPIIACFCIFIVWPCLGPLLTVLLTRF